MSTDNNKKEYNGNELVVEGTFLNGKILKTTSLGNNDEKGVKEGINSDNKESKKNNIEENGEEEVTSLTFAEASQVMKFLASAAPSEDFKTSIKTKLNTDKNSDLSNIFDLDGNIKITAFREMSETAKTFFNESNEGKKILRAINVLKTIFLALSDESVKFGNNGLGKTLLSILKGWGVENKPNDETVIEVSKILASIKSMGGSKLLGDEFKSPEKNSKDYERMVKEYNITEKQLESNDNFVKDFINNNKALGNLLRIKLNFSKDQKSQILKNAIVPQKLSTEILDKIVALFKTIGSSPEIGDVVKNEILSRGEESDEKTTSKVPLLGRIYNALASSYTFLAKVLRKIVNGDGDITFNVFLIDDKEFEVAMKAFEDIYQENSNDVAFGNLLKMIKILRICANQKDNQMAKKFKNYTEANKKIAISNLLDGLLAEIFILGNDDGPQFVVSADGTEGNFIADGLFFSNFEFSKEDVDDIEKCVLESGAIIHNMEQNEEQSESEEIGDIIKSEVRSEGIDKYKSVIMKPDSNNKNMAIIEILSSLGKIKLNVGLTKTLDCQSMKFSFDQKEFKERKLQVLQLISKKMIGPHNLLEGTTGLEVSKTANGIENKFQEQTVRQILYEYANIIILPSLFNQHNPEVKISSIRNLTFYPSDEFKKNPLFASVVKQFSQARPTLNQLSQLVTGSNIIMEEKTEANTKEQKEIGTKKMLENAVAPQKLSTEILDKIVDFLSITINSNQEISNGVKNEVLSRSKELDEKTTSKVPVLGMLYNAVASSYTFSAKVLQKIVNGYGDITFNVFLINDEEFKVAMKAFEDICLENNNDLAFGNLLKMIKILRICANQKDNQMAKKFEGYTEEHKQTAISTLLSSNFFLQFISGSELKNDSNNLQNDRAVIEHFFSNFKFFKKDIEDIKKLVSSEEDKVGKNEEKKKDEKGGGSNSYESWFKRHSSNNVNVDNESKENNNNGEGNNYQIDKDKNLNGDYATWFDKHAKKTPNSNVNTDSNGNEKDEKKERNKKEEGKKEDRTEENKVNKQSQEKGGDKSVSAYSDAHSEQIVTFGGEKFWETRSELSQTDDDNKNIAEKRSHGKLGTKYRLPDIDWPNQEMDLENLNLSLDENKRQKKKKNKEEEKRENEEDEQNQKENENNNKHDLNRSADNILVDQNRYNSEENSSGDISGNESTKNTTQQSLISEKQIKPQSEKESHVLRRIGIVLLGLVIAVLFAAALTFALAAIPGVGPVIGGILGKTFVDAAALSIASVVPLGWVVGGIGAFGTTIGGVFFGKNIKTLWTPENEKVTITDEIEGHGLDINDKKLKELPNSKTKTSLLEKLKEIDLPEYHKDDFSIGINNPLKFEKRSESREKQNEK